MHYLCFSIYYNNDDLKCLMQVMSLAKKMPVLPTGMLLFSSICVYCGKRCNLCSVNCHPPQRKNEMRDEIPMQMANLASPSVKKSFLTLYMQYTNVSHQNIHLGHLKNALQTIMCQRNLFIKMTSNQNKTWQNLSLFGT